MTAHTYYCKRHLAGHSLLEVLVAIVIASMILLAVLGIYGRVQQSASAIIQSLEQHHLPSEVLQLIAEDIDRCFDASDSIKSDINIKIRNKIDSGYSISQLVISKSYKDKDMKEQVLEEIIWQGDVDFASNRIVLYRSHSGILLEDKLLDAPRALVEQSYPFIPVCGGLTAFRIRVPQGENWLDKWENPSLPTGIEVMISQVTPKENPLGQLEIAEKDQIIRTMAINRLRTMKFEVPKEKEGDTDEQSQDLRH